MKIFFTNEEIHRVGNLKSTICVLRKPVEVLYETEMIKYVISIPLYYTLRQSTLSIKRNGGITNRRVNGILVVKISFKNVVFLRN